MANKISLKSQDFNITSRKGNITLCEKHRISPYKKYYPKKSFVLSSSGSFLSYTVAELSLLCVAVGYLIKIGWICFPVRAYFRVSSKRPKSQTKELGFSKGISCPKGRK